MRKIIIGGVALTAAAVTLTACNSKYTEQFKDAPRSGANTEPALTIDMPDGFTNVATKCVGDVRYTVAFHSDGSYAAVSTLLDPLCKHP